MIAVFDIRAEHGPSSWPSDFRLMIRPEFEEAQDKGNGCFLASFLGCFKIDKPIYFEEKGSGLADPRQDSECPR